MSPEKQWVPIGNLHDEEAWDDSALIRAYDGAIDAYQVSFQTCVRPLSPLTSRVRRQELHGRTPGGHVRTEHRQKWYVPRHAAPCTPRVHSRLIDPSRLLPAHPHPHLNLLPGAPPPRTVKLVREARG